MARLRGQNIVKRNIYIRPKAEKNFWFSVRKKPVVFLKEACGVEFLKHGGVVNFSRVMGVDPPLACLLKEALIGLHPECNCGRHKTLKRP